MHINASVRRCFSSCCCRCLLRSLFCWAPSVTRNYVQPPNNNRLYLSRLPYTTHVLRHVTRPHSFSFAHCLQVPVPICARTLLYQVSRIPEKKKKINKPSVRIKSRCIYAYTYAQRTADTCWIYSTEGERHDSLYPRQLKREDFELCPFLCSVFKCTV